MYGLLVLPFGEYISVSKLSHTTLTKPDYESDIPCRLGSAAAAAAVADEMKNFIITACDMIIIQMI
jgi:hypothetical protein